MTQMFANIHLCSLPSLFSFLPWSTYMTLLGKEKKKYTAYTRYIPICLFYVNRIQVKSTAIKKHAPSDLVVQEVLVLQKHLVVPCRHTQYFSRPIFYVYRTFHMNVHQHLQFTNTYSFPRLSAISLSSWSTINTLHLTFIEA